MRNVAIQEIPVRVTLASADGKWLTTAGAAGPGWGADTQTVTPRPTGGLLRRRTTGLMSVKRARRMATGSQPAVSARVRVPAALDLELFPRWYSGTPRLTQ